MRRISYELADNAGTLEIVGAPGQWDANWTAENGDLLEWILDIGVEDYRDAVLFAEGQFDVETLDETRVEHRAD